MTILRKLARTFGVLGGIGAIAWAMRDRLISLAVPREPEPPAFRAVPAAPPTTSKATTPRAAAPDAASASDGSDLTAVPGIGPTYAGRLRAAGIDDLSALATAQPDRVAEAAGVSIGVAERWILHAQELTGN